MKIIAAYFDRKGKYRNLVKVFKHSAKATMPDIGVKIFKPRIPRKITRKHDMAYCQNVTSKAVIEAREEAIVCDIDLLFIKSVADVFQRDFDVAFTVRSGYKYNTGIWFYKPTNAAQIFVQRWIDNTIHLMRHWKAEKDIIGQYAGIDQASLALTIEENQIAKVLELPCQEWNATQTEWANFDDKTRVLHIKSALRKYAMKHNHAIPEQYQFLIPLADMWRKYL